MPDEALGMGLALGAAAAFAAGAIFVRLGLQGISSRSGTLVSLIVGWVFVAALTLILYRDAVLALPAVAFVWFLAIGVVNFPIGRFLNFTATHLVGVARATPIIATSPMIAGVLAIVFLGETLTLPIALGTFGVVAGVGLVMSSR